MQVSTSPLPPVAPAQASGLASGIANGIRAIGEGARTASDMTAVSSEKGYIYPVESAFTVGQLIKAATANKGILGKVGDKAPLVLTFAASYHGLMVAGMLRNPGNTIADIANGIADKIDGKSTVQPAQGFGWTALTQAQAANKALGRS